MVERTIYYEDEQSEMIHEVMDIIVPNEYDVCVVKETYEHLVWGGYALNLILDSQKDWVNLKKYFPKPKGKQLPNVLNLKGI